jgi:hypothetical protein
MAQEVLYSFLNKRRIYAISGYFKKFRARLVTNDFSNISGIDLQ